MTILVTRPEQESQALCDALQKLGHHAISHPLLTIHPGKELSQLPTLLSSLSDGDFLITVSQHAVQHAQDYLQLQQKEWKKGINYIAVGQKSAQYLRSYISDPVHFPTPSDSEHLLALPVLDNVAGKKYLFYVATVDAISFIKLLKSLVQKSPIVKPTNVNPPHLMAPLKLKSGKRTT